MNTKTILAVTTVAALSFSGCAFNPGVGAIYKDQMAPVHATDNGTAAKVGTSDECISILGLIATGDCSIESAKKNGGITNVSSVDFKTNGILGIFSKGNTIVRGK